MADKLTLAHRFKGHLQAHYIDIAKAAGARWEVERVGTSLVVKLFGRVAIPESITTEAEGFFTSGIRKLDDNWDDSSAEEHWASVTFLDVTEK